MAEPLKFEQIEEAIQSLSDWDYDDDKLKKEFSFGDFREAMAFITMISFDAEEQVHHPEIFNVYSTVNISLSTHDAGGKVTEKDIKLAKAIEEVYQRFSN